MDDGELMEPMEEVPLIGLGESFGITFTA